MVKKIGNLKTNGIVLSSYERKTVQYFLKQGNSIELIIPSNTPKNKNADFIMNGLLWEMKFPTGKSLLTLQHLFRKASKQSENIIFDLRGCRNDETSSVRMLVHMYKISKSAKRLLIIKKDGSLSKYH